MEINITNEYSKLEKVVVCKADYYDENKVAINNMWSATSSTAKALEKPIIAAFVVA